MGKVNVVLPNGRVVSVDEEDAQAMTSAANVGTRTAGAGEALDQQRQDDEGAIRHKVYGGALGSVESAAGGALDAMTFGLGMRALDAVDSGVMESYQKSVAEHPTYNKLGETAGMFTPGIGEFALAGDAGKLAARALGAGTRTARFTEGALVGLGGAVAHANASGDPLTAEALVEDAAIAGVLNIGAGALADRFTAVGARAQKALEAQRATERAEKLFSEESPAYNALRDARDAARKSGMEDFRDAQLIKNKYDSYLGDAARMEKVGDGIQTAIDDMQAYRMERFGADTLGISAEEKGVLATIQSAERRLFTARALLRAGDAEGADRIFRTLSEFMAEESPVPISGRIPAMPQLPSGTPVPPLDLRLPNDLAGFANMGEQKIAGLANHLADYSTATSSEVEALQKLAGELGLQAKDSPAELLADVHGTLRGHAEALDALEETSKKSMLERAVRWAARRGSEVFGSRTLGKHFGPVGSVAGWVAGGTVADAVTSAAMEARAGLRGRVADMVARWAPRAGRAVEALGPVTSSLAYSMTGGRKESGDLSDLAAKRVAELRATAITAPDTLYEGVRALATFNGQVAMAVHQKALNAIRDIAAKAPKDPGLTMLNGKSEWRPGPTEALSLAYRWEALHDPMKAIKRALSGEVHTDAIDTLNSSWPALMGLVQNELAGREFGENSGGASAILGSAQFGIDDPMATINLQGMYLPKPQTQQGGGNPTPSALGRPPAVGPSKTAGSNVGLLISQ